MARKLFCEINSVTYRISVLKGTLLRRLHWITDKKCFASKRIDNCLPVTLYEHKSLIQRRLGNLDMTLQENKAVNLGIVVPKVNGIVIRPGETFSFWRLAGNCNKKRGFKEGMYIKGGASSKGVGGGMCQFTNLLHWLVLHSPLTITEHHHHNSLDLFPDYGRQLPFGTGTSIMYNYIDYQFKNETDQTFQIKVSIDEGYLKGELLSEKEIEFSYHIVEENHFFTEEDGIFFRNNEVYRVITDKSTGNRIEKKQLLINHAKVMYGKEFIPIELLRR